MKKQEIPLESKDLAGALLEATWRMYQETGEEIHYKAWRDLKDGNVKPFECENGKISLMPVKHCVFCKNCQDLIYDDLGPYMFGCDLRCDSFKTCGKFEEG